MIPVLPHNHIIEYNKKKKENILKSTLSASSRVATLEPQNSGVRKLLQAVWAVPAGHPQSTQRACQVS